MSDKTDKNIPKWVLIIKKMDKKQTAVEWLVDKLMKGEFINSTDELINQAKQMEKEQIDSALAKGHSDCGVFTMQSECDEYYNKTYNSKQ